MPLNIEVRKTYEAKWVNIGEILPGKETTPMRNFNFQGEQETIVFMCAEDDLSSTIFIFKKSKNKLSDLPSIISDHLKAMEVQVLESGNSYIIESRKWTDEATKYLRLTHT